jgi:spermidine synthase
VFPNGIIFSNDEKGEGYDAVLLGQVEPTQIDVEGMQKTLDSKGYERVKQSLMEVGLGTESGSNVAAELLATYAGRGPDMLAWSKVAVDSGNLNTDANLRLQYLAGLYLNNYVASGILDDMLRYYRFPSEIFTGSAQQIELLRGTLAQEGRERFMGTAEVRESE